MVAKTFLAAPAAAIFPSIKKLVKFNARNSWIKKEPAATGGYSGRSEGTDASYRWEGGGVVTWAISGESSVFPSVDLHGALHEYGKDDQ